jgi:FtsP/CotA-like multicopper oxidase with cupredoxin domain
MGHDMKSMPGMDKGGSDKGGMDMSKMTPEEHRQHRAMGHDMPAGGSPSKPPMNGKDMSKMSPADMEKHKAMGHDMSGMTMPGTANIPTSNADGVDPATLAGQPGVDNVAMETRDKLGEAGIGLDGNGRRNLTYRDLKAVRPHRRSPPAARAIEFHLTGNMERFLWGFDGKKFSQAGPIRVALGERIRFVLINDTMMEHPIHLHGYLFEVENGQGDRLPLKHTINVKPAERMSFVFTADAPGHWAFHCHLLYHMEAGMFRTVLVA